MSGAGAGAGADIIGSESELVPEPPKKVAAPQH